MIPYCTCTGGSASAHSVSTSPSVSTLGCATERAVTSLCKICGCKKFFNGKGPASVNMLGTVGLGFPRVIDPDLNWRKDSKAPKGNRRARRARSELMGFLKKDTTRSSKDSSEDQIDKCVKREVDIPVSESEKLGVSVLGRRFSNMTESVPFKKRRIPLVRSPSPPPPTHFPHLEESKRLLKTQPTYGMKELKPNLDAKTYGSDDTFTSRKSFQVVIPKKARDGRINVQDRLEKSVDNVDFYGISILAAAACNSNMGGGTGNGDDLLVAENSSVANNKPGSPCSLENTGCLTVLEEVHEKHLRVNNNATSNCVSSVEESIGVHVDDAIISVRTPSLYPENAMVLSIDSQNTENGVLGRDESSYLRDNRSHWDLNTVMDAWEIPDDATIDPQQNPVLDTCEDDVCSEAPGSLASCLHGRVLVNEHDNGCGFTDLRTSSEQSSFSKICLDTHLDLVSLNQNLDIRSSSCSLLIKHNSPACDSELKVHEKPDYSHNDSVVHCPPNKNDDACLSVPGIHESSAGEDHELDVCKWSDSDPNNVTDVTGETKHLDTQVNISYDVVTVGSYAAEHALNSPECSSLQSNRADAIGNSVVLGHGLSEEENGVISPHLVCSIDSYVEDTTNVFINITGTDQTVLEESIDAMGSDVAKCSTMVDVGNEDSGNPCTAGEQDIKHVDPLSCDSGTQQLHNHLVTCNDSGKGSGKVDGCLTVGLESDPLVDRSSMTCNVVQPAHTVKVMSDFENQDEAVEVTGYGLDTNNSFISQGASNCEELVLTGAYVGEEEGTVVANVEVKGFAIADESLQPAEMDLSDDSDPKVSICTPVNMVLGIICTQSITEDLSPQTKPSTKCDLDDHAMNSIEVPVEEDYETDVSQKDHVCATSMEMASELPVDDDSQYEDGELRESALHGWGEDGGEEGEAENLDYGYSDNRDTDDVGAAGDDPTSALLQVESTQCRGEGSSDACHIDHEGHIVDVQHRDRVGHVTISELYRQGISQTGIPDTRIATNREVMVVKKVSQGQLGKKNGIEKLEKNELVQELGVTQDKMMEGGDHQVGIEGVGPSASSKIKSSGWDQLPEGGSNSAQVVNNIGEGSANKGHGGGGFDGVSNAGETLKRVIGSTSSRDLSSRIEVPKSSDISLRINRFYTPESRADEGNSNIRGENDFGRVKSSGWGNSSVHMHGRGRGGDQWLDSSGGHWAKHRHSPGYCGPAIFGSKNAAAVAAAKVESSGFVVAADGTIVRAAGAGNVGRVGGRSVNVSSQSMHQTLTRRGSPADREGAMGYSLRIGLGPRRDMSPVDRRINVGRDGSSGYVPSMVGTSHRERYHAPLADGRIESSLLMERSLARRERSFSPIQRRASPVHPSRSHTKSPSRSRTRSPPHLWTSPRRRSAGGINRGQILRRRSRSPPIFRPKNRMERTKSPQRPAFPQHMASSIVSSSRNHGSPAPRIHDRRDVDHFRDHDYKRASFSERSPPGRVFSRCRRYDVMDSPVRLKHDEYYRSVHSGRFSEFASDVRGPLRHDMSDEDRRKHGSRYPMAHFTRPCDIDGGKRFRYDVEDGFRVHNPRSKNGSEFHERGSPREYDRGIDTRFGPAPPGRGRSREDKGHLRYGRDGRQNSGLDSFGVQGGDDDVASRRREP